MAKEESGYYFVKPRRLWGDYGDILISGLARRDPATGDLIIQRTGPFVPPIAGPYGSPVLVSDDGREFIDSLRLSGVAFRRVKHEKVVSLDWPKWNLNAEAPPEYPRSGEPEDYVLSRRHSERVATETPAQWELLAPFLVWEVDRYREDLKVPPRFLASSPPLDPPEIFYSHPPIGGSYVGHCVVNRRVRDRLQERFGDWVWLPAVTLVDELPADCG